MMLCYFVQRFCRNRMWLASRVSPLEAPRVQQAGGARRSSISRARQCALSHESRSRDRGVSRRSKRSSNRRATARAAAQRGKSDERAPSLRSALCAEFSKFFSKFFVRRQAGKAARFARQSRCADKHPRIMMPTSQRPLKKRDSSCIRQILYTRTQFNGTYMQVRAFVDSMSERSSNSI